MPSLQDVRLSLVPADGSTIGNISLRSLVGDKLDRDVDEGEYFVARDALVAAGKLEAKRAELARWVKGVNAKGGFGQWASDVLFQPSQIQDVLERHGGAG